MALLRRTLPLFILVICIIAAFWALLFSTKALFFNPPEYQRPPKAKLDIEYPNPLPNTNLTPSDYLIQTISPSQVSSFEECVAAGGVVVGLRTELKECTFLDDRVFRNY